ncbi:transcriptional regulator [Mesorhizobium helmanticense]|uniref:Transcriptional regulator n=1 Tax=Mesorhizobium helmanticense TaxID=1776423 RepID=A0A2T4J139_9HYPH|nr:transcriptional regulator [Mesorhizobium helmanticense]PTE11547.1 transcriptional regulator [Mesorhizobium helmanticense]
MNTVTAALTIPEFCQANRISRGSFYNLKKAGKAPRLMVVGNRVLISPEANAEWRLAREQDALTVEVAA